MNLISLNAINVGLLNADAYNLTIALVVFVLLTALLAAFIIMLFAWKRFRDFFFKYEKTEKKKEKAKKPNKPAKAEKAPADKKKQPVKNAKQQAEPQRASKRAHASGETHYSNNYYDDGVPTVPLDGPKEFTMTADSGKQNSKRSGNTLYKIPTVVITTPKTAERTTAHNTQEIKKQTAVKAVKPAATTATTADKKSATPRKNGK